MAGVRGGWGLGLILAAGLGEVAAGPGQEVQVQAAVLPWRPATPYRAGDLATYLGVPYRCRKDHTSQAGREPPAVPDLWRVFNPETAAVPGVPKGLAAVAGGADRIVVCWNPLEGATSYDLEADGQTVTAVASPHVHRGLAPGSRHAYRVRACNGAGAGPWSAPVVCATEGPTSGR